MAGAHRATPSSTDRHEVGAGSGLVLAAQDVHFTVNRNHVLRGLDVDVRPGEAVALVGPSGSGKSTAMAIFGLMAIRDSGTLSVLGIELPRRPPRPVVDQLRRHMSWLPQFPLVMPGRSAVDNILVGARTTGRFSRSLLDEIVDAVGIGYLLQRTVSVLSGGELQKVALARALINEPQVILADEPTASLDADSTALVVDALRVASRYAAVLVATHDRRLSSVCDRSIELTNGRAVHGTHGVAG
jgi:ABC-type lipoprotein export system ATPase subunit